MKQEGVETVMRIFFSAHTNTQTEQPTASAAITPRKSKRDAEEDVVCEEKLLEAFAR